jgi:hypothetical protein
MKNKEEEEDPVWLDCDLSALDSSGFDRYYELDGHKFIVHGCSYCKFLEGECSEACLYPLKGSTSKQKNDVKAKKDGFSFGNTPNVNLCSLLSHHSLDPLFPKDCPLRKVDFNYVPHNCVNCAEHAKCEYSKKYLIKAAARSWMNCWKQTEEDKKKFPDVT